MKEMYLYQDNAVRESLHKLVAEPLEREGIDHFTAKYKGNRETVDKSEGPYFKYDPMAEGPLLDETRELTVSIVSLIFKEENKWRLRDNDSGIVISATIVDRDFLARVANNDVSFSRGDILICKVRMRQYLDGSSRKTKHTVEKVIEHRHRPPERQSSLLTLFPSDREGEN